MADDWATNVRKYVADADDAIISGIVSYCGIALRNRDSSLVSFSDPEETGRVRQNFLRKKLGRDDADDILDSAIASVGERMKGENFKNRVTVYYLLAEHFGALEIFRKKSAAKSKAKPDTGGGAGIAGAAAGAAVGAGALGLAALGGSDSGEASAAQDEPEVAAVASSSEPVEDAAEAVEETSSDNSGSGMLAGAAGAAAVGTAATVAATQAPVPPPPVHTHALADSAATGSNDEDSGLGWLWWLLLLLLGLLLLWWLFFRSPAPDAAAGGVSAPTEAAAPAAAASGNAGAAADATASGAVGAMAALPAEGSVQIPAGAGVTSEMREGKPVVKVYFDTGKTTVAPAFGDAATGLKAWLAANAGSSLAVSGYNDASGNAAANAELSKNRAMAVRDALVAAGVAEGSVEMVKPEQTTDTTVAKEAARRVEVVVR